MKFTYCLITYQGISKRFKLNPNASSKSSYEVCSSSSKYSFYFVTTNDPLRSAESSRQPLLEQESESGPEPFSSLREEYET